MDNQRLKALAQGITTGLGTIGFIFFVWYSMFSLVKLTVTGVCK